MADDIYAHANAESTDRITERNVYPKAQPEEKQYTSNLEGNVAPQTVDHFQEHDFEQHFGETSGLLSVYDPFNPDRQFFDIVETEMIQISSPPIKYYKLLHQQNNIDPLYSEARRRDGYMDPVVVYGHYDDPSPSQELVQYGLQNLEDIEIWFNYNNLLRTIGDKLQVGDILQTYDAKLWEVMTSIVVDEALWRAQHNMIKAKRLTTEGIFLPSMPNITRSPNRPKVGTSSSPVIPSKDKL